MPVSDRQLMSVGMPVFMIIVMSLIPACLSLLQRDFFGFIINMMHPIPGDLLLETDFLQQVFHGLHHNKNMSLTDIVIAFEKSTLTDITIDGAKKVFTAAIT